MLQCNTRWEHCSLWIKKFYLEAEPEQFFPQFEQLEQSPQEFLFETLDFKPALLLVEEFLLFLIMVTPF